MKRILITAGESSGDLHAANLIKELKSIKGDLKFFGIGCDKMQSEGVHLLRRMDSLSIVGVLEVLSNLVLIRNLFNTINKEISKEKVDLAILVDYPGFNLVLAKMLKKRNIPCIYYITPQVWAWGSWRVKSIRECIKKAITILRFEEDFFKEKGIDATFVGHPLLDEYHKGPSIKESKSLVGLDPDKFTIALLPGSRTLEVKRMLPVMLKTSRIIKDKRDVQFMISQSPNVDEENYKAIKESDAKIIKNDIYKCLNAADFVLTSSGTVTLQAALAEKPMLITYITSSFTYFMGKMFVKTPYIGLVNIIAQKNIVPEILQYDANPKKLSDKVLKIISSEEEMNKMRSELINVKGMLGSKGASRRASEIIAGFL